MQPETFSRALAKLRRHGVTCHGADVVIADIAVLRRIGADQPPCAPRDRPALSGGSLACSSCGK
jgi:hypothetical protein